MQNLGVISVNIWQILISIINLFLLFLILKKFLYKPVRNFIANRETEVNKTLTDAQKTKEEAMTLKEEWENQTKSIKIQAEEKMTETTNAAKKRSDEIISEAKDKAENIISNAKLQAQLEQKKAESEIKEQVVVLSNQLTEKLLQREVNTNDNKELIDSFLEQVGQNNG